MAKDKLNNMLSFKDYSTLCKLENKPGKVVENLNHLSRFDEANIATHLYDAGKKYYSDKASKSALAKIQGHPMRKKHYETLLKEDPQKAAKYLDFWKEGEFGIPKWDDELGEFVDASLGVGF